MCFLCMIVKILVCLRGAFEQLTMVSVSKIFSLVKSLKYTNFAHIFLTHSTGCKYARQFLNQLCSKSLIFHTGKTQSFIFISPKLI